ncbi:MAG: type VI secretion system tube protein Hcp [Deltaproteobacteria bacterium]|nr:type VI secretion system tube protein Hcp [Deltaproteobacteria bacterium]
MAMSTFLTLKADGNDIEGSAEDANREGTIECASFDWGVNAAMAAGTPTADRDYEPIRIVKRIDKATPLIWQAMCQNAKIEAKFCFYRPPTADEDAMYFMVEITDGRIATIDVNSPHSNFDSPSSQAMPTETVTLVYNNITNTFTDGNVTHTDEWKNRA